MSFFTRMAHEKLSVIPSIYLRLNLADHLIQTKHAITLMAIP